MKLHPKFKDFFSHFYLAIEWRIIASLITFVAAYVISGDIKISVGITSVEAIAKIIVQAVWLQHRVKRHYKKIV